MMISSKGRYALRVMLDLAEQGSNKYISLKDIAERQDISRKYLESIMTELSKNELVESAIGKTGGYKLKRAPENYKVGEILYAAEGELTPVSCIKEYVNSYTLKDVLELKNKQKNSCCKCDSHNENEDDVI